MLRALGYSILGIATAGAAGTDKAADAVTGRLRFGGHYERHQVTL